jgi:hypothetical protein
MKKTLLTIIIIIAVFVALRLLTPVKEVDSYESLNAFGRPIAIFIVLVVAGFLLYRVHRK